jgi:putative transcriptional regulator
MTRPTPAQVLAARKAAGMTQTEAAEIVYSSLRAWQQWEAGDRSMHPAIWQWWLHRTAARRRSLATSRAQP